MQSFLRALYPHTSRALDSSIEHQTPGQILRGNFPSNMILVKKVNKIKTVVVKLINNQDLTKQNAINAKRNRIKAKNFCPENTTEPEIKKVYIYILYIYIYSLPATIKAQYRPLLIVYN
jgi:hypothetical protein